MIIRMMTTIIYYHLTFFQIWWLAPGLRRRALLGRSRALDRSRPFHDKQILTPKPCGQEWKLVWSDWIIWRKFIDFKTDRSKSGQLHSSVPTGRPRHGPPILQLKHGCLSLSKKWTLNTYREKTEYMTIAIIRLPPKNDNYSESISLSGLVYERLALSKDHQWRNKKILRILVLQNMTSTLGLLRI